LGWFRHVRKPFEVLHENINSTEGGIRKKFKGKNFQMSERLEGKRTGLPGGPGHCLCKGLTHLHTKSQKNTTAFLNSTATIIIDIF
jgi:hypothetical protein